MILQKLTILGSTGSIGVNTLDVIRRHPHRYRVIALCAHNQIDRLFDQCLEFQPRFAVVRDAHLAVELQRRLLAVASSTLVESGPEALVRMAELPEVDSVMAAIVGAAGLQSTLAAALAGKKVLLANKEALVMAGPILMRAIRENGATLLPIDSEHNAIFQSLPSCYANNLLDCGVSGIVLTASGGPFRTRDPATLHSVTPEEAIAHPNWVMGRKISVDSATMMNKALEVIEARWLFDLAPEQIKVVIHPQSIIHSMVVCRDGCVLAQLGTPDMRGPISYGLSFPQRIESGAARLDFSQLAALSFEDADAKRFPGLHLAWAALHGPEGSTTVLNAANEVAVAAFLDRQIGFDAIHRINAETISTVSPQLGDAPALDDLLALDQRARAHARQRVLELAR